jgi:hypothetical protein
MMRRSGKPLDECERYARAPGVADDGAGYMPRPWASDRKPRNQLARGTALHPEGEFNLFTGR